MSWYIGGVDDMDWWWGIEDITGGRDGYIIRSIGTGGTRDVGGGTSNLTDLKG